MVIPFQSIERMSQFTYMVYMGHFALTPGLYFLSSHYFRVRVRNLAISLLKKIRNCFFPNRAAQGIAVNSLQNSAAIAEADSVRNSGRSIPRTVPTMPEEAKVK